MTDQPGVRVAAVRAYHTWEALDVEEREGVALQRTGQLRRVLQPPRVNRAPTAGGEPVLAVAEQRVATPVRRADVELDDCVVQAGVKASPPPQG